MKLLLVLAMSVSTLLAAAVDGPKLNTKARLKVKGASVELVKYKVNSREKQLVVRRKATREMANSKPLIYEEHILLDVSGGIVTFCYVHQARSSDKPYPLDRDAELQWRDPKGKTKKYGAFKAGTGSVIEGYEEYSIWLLTVEQFLEITDKRFTIKTSAGKKITVSPSKDDKEAMRWAVWQWSNDGEETIRKRYGKKYNR